MSKEEEVGSVASGVSDPKEEVKNNNESEALATLEYLRNAEVKAAEEGVRSIESLTRHQTQEFDSLRKVIKKFAPMFAFGDPTAEMVYLMIKVYHENIIRLLSDSTDFPSKAGTKLNCMFGIMYSGETIYCTISESPGTDKKLNSPSDKDYMAKRNMMINLLLSAGIEVGFPEIGDTTNPFPPHIPHSATRWRKGPKEGDNWETIPSVKQIREKIEATPALKEVMFLDPEYKTSNIHIYHRAIRNLPPKKVLWVDSFEYLARRQKNEKTGKSKGMTFRPFKKYSVSNNGKEWKAECNNGHICTESKLFGYATIKGKSVDSFVAYWIGKAPPPENHIIRNYCYRTIGNDAEFNKFVSEGETKYTEEQLRNQYDAEIMAEQNKLTSLFAQCRNTLVPYLTEGNPIFEIKKAHPEFAKVIRQVVQPCAIVCPGCFANIIDYKLGRFHNWDIRDCYIPRKTVPMYNEPAEGGKRTTKKKQRKSKKEFTRKGVRK
jgi:hypothetical protein